MPSTRLLRYAITAIGIIVTFGAMGLRWSGIQWLVAALSVGLGFGLQEIVANFVCGLIILFERPFRVGDVVTIGDQTGTVTRIQIRATTVTDWDRRELIVPNKEFITGKLINWSLSDPITRVVVPVGVAYGSGHPGDGKAASQNRPGEPDGSESAGALSPFPRLRRQQPQF